ncbi:MAG: response regulator [Synergistaceae bacterium]|nr:response regulator [Synergistaceae bacterium]
MKPLEGRRILLCEDHDINATVTIEMLEKGGAVVERAWNGAEGVRMFSESEPGYFRAILMDVRMPQMDGLAATRTIRAMDREDAAKIPIVAMTVNFCDEDIQASLDSGMNAHLIKPVEPKEIYELLDSMTKAF